MFSSIDQMTHHVLVYHTRFHHQLGYSSGRHKIQDAVKEELDKSLGDKGIIIENVMLKDLELPESLSKAIELKAQAE